MEIPVTVIALKIPRRNGKMLLFRVDLVSCVVCSVSLPRLLLVGSRLMFVLIRLTQSLSVVMAPVERTRNL